MDDITEALTSIFNEGKTAEDVKDVVMRKIVFESKDKNVKKTVKEKNTKESN
jgi:hypothetical protein